MVKKNPRDTRLTPDEALDRILVRAKSPLAEGEVREIIEKLEGTLQSERRISKHMKTRCFRGLVKICGEHGILPNSYIIPGSEIQKLGESPIASGGFSDVWPGIHGEDDSVAIKVIRYYASDDIKKIKKNFCREVITWRHVSHHQNVLKLIGVLMNGKEYALVSPWMENGNIVEFLGKTPKANPLKLLEDAARGLEHLHKIELAHGDLKGGNILISDDGDACLADVGLTRIAAELNSVTATGPASAGAVTLRWSPPELLDPERFGSKRPGPTKMGDVYSMAMTIYEVLTGRQPFDGDNDGVAMLNILGGVRPKKPVFAGTRGYTEELWQMTTSCWVEKASERPPVDLVLKALSAAR